MRVADFRFDLPADLIAQHPPAERGASRMLVLDRRSGAVEDRQFRELPSFLRQGDLLVVNDSRVLPARLYATRAGSLGPPGSSRPSGRIEVLLTHPRRNPRDPGEAHEWHALVRPGRKVRPGEQLLFAAEEAPETPLLTAEVLSAGDFGERVLRFAPALDFAATLDRIGHMPLPPYIERPAQEADSPEDRERYQTVYARAAADGRASGNAVSERSAAAPTAGLHFTPGMLAAVRARGVEVATVTLHVGLGTFQPVRVAETDAIRLHSERFTLSAETANAVNGARAAGRRVIAVGTTTTRTLEHCARMAEQEGRRELAAGSGETSLFLSPGAEFRVISGLLTNFHLPESTLLMLVSAFAGTAAVLRAYNHAVRERYRFFSYGDCMLVL